MATGEKRSGSGLGGGRKFGPDGIEARAALDMAGAWAGEGVFTDGQAGDIGGAKGAPAGQAAGGAFAADLEAMQHGDAVGGAAVGVRFDHARATVVVEIQDAAILDRPGERGVGCGGDGVRPRLGGAGLGRCVKRK